MLAGGRGGNGLGKVQMHGRGDVDSVKVRVGQQVGVAGLGALHAECAAKGLQPGRVAPAGGRQPAVRIVADRPRETLAGNVPDAFLCPMPSCLVGICTPVQRGRRYCAVHHGYC
jgi:hypothetical protein